jgi:hypothetical protein
MANICSPFYRVTNDFTVKALEATFTDEDINLIKDRIINIDKPIFTGCSSITNINFPKCTDIGDNAFVSCTSLTSISFPVCTSIGNSAFYNCTSLTTISFPVCTSIGSWAFVSCTSLTSISFPECTSIGSSAFYGCTSLTSISFPECTSIGNSAFYNCTKLASLYFMGNTVPTLGRYAFDNTPLSRSTYIGEYGSIYVRSDKLNSFKTATNWSRYSARMVGV